MTAKSLIPSSRCSAPLVSKCIPLYNEVVSKVYKLKTKPNTFQQSLDDDDWRFNSLPAQLSPVNRSTSLTKENLTRLVRWKITHGVYRPFLPAQVQKNDAETVLEVTAATAKILLQLDGADEAAEACILNALKEVTKLRGVGPATGSLVLSVLAPEKVVFFQDELFGWLFPEHGKLKYDVKEYRMLLGKCGELMGELGVKAWELEKAGYVVVHSDVLEEEQRRDLVDVAGAEDGDRKVKQNGGEAEDAVEDADGAELRKKQTDVGKRGAVASTKARPSTKPAKRTASPPTDTKTRRSKRRKE